MFEELQLALMDLVIPERLFVILDAYTVLMELGINDIDDELQQIIGLQDGISDSELFISRINSCITATLLDTITEYGIRVNDDVGVIVLTAILRTIANFDNYIIPDTLDMLLVSDLTPIEKVAAIIPLFTEMSEDEALESINHVDNNVILRMRFIVSEQLTKQTTTVDRIPDQDVRVKRINAIKNRTNGQHPFITFELANQGIAIGCNFEIILTESLERLEPLEATDVAYELLGLVYFSNTPIGDVKQVLHETTLELYDDIETRKRLNKQISIIYNEFAGIDEVVL